MVMEAEQRNARYKLPKTAVDLPSMVTRVPESHGQENPPRIADCLLLLGVVIVSAFPYQFGLGLYLDDWQYFGTLDRFSGDGLVTMFREMIKVDPDLHLRPVQVTWLVLGFKAFGLHPMPYHIVISAVLGFVAVLLYLALRELMLNRWMAFVIALVFGLLPHYSTVRVWISSLQAGLCMAFALLGIYALSRSVRPGEKHSMKWMALAVSAFALSILSYEVALGLIIASFGIIGWLKYFEIRGSSKSGLANLGGIAGTAAALLLVLIVKARVQTRVVYHHHFFALLGERSWHAFEQAVLFNFWTYGLHMPSFLIRLYRESALSVAATGVATIIALVVTAYLWRYMGPSAIPSRRVFIWFMVAGFVLFGLGYALFFASSDIDFSSPGLQNRVAIASALGASFVLVALFGMACSILKNDSLRVRVFGILVGMICGANSLVVSGIAHYWEDAASREAVILNSVSANVPSLPRGSVLLLDGFCVNTGPAFLILSNEDTTSALSLALRDYSLAGDVITRDTHFGPSTVTTTIFGNPDVSYPYGDHLFVYNVRHGFLASLPSHEAAHKYLQAMHSDGEDACQAEGDWDGTKVS